MKRVENKGIICASLKKRSKVEGSGNHLIFTKNIGGKKHYLIYMSYNKHFQYCVVSEASTKCVPSFRSIDLTSYCHNIEIDRRKLFFSI